MQRIWTLKTWSLVLIVVVVALGLTGLTAIYRCRQMVIDAEHEFVDPEGAAVKANSAGPDDISAMEVELRLWAAAVVVLTALAALLFALHRRYVQEYLLFPLRRIAGYLDRVGRGERFLRLPSQKEEALNDIVISGNDLIQRFNKFVDESQRSGSNVRHYAQAVINTFTDIALLINDAGDPVLVNKKAQELPATLPLNDLVKKVSTVLDSDARELESNGHEFNILEAMPAETKFFSGRLIVLREKARKETEG
ncbi:MAG: hypothetical protein R6V56_04200 [Lentisphaeria bacterium]